MIYLALKKLKNRLSEGKNNRNLEKQEKEFYQKSKHEIILNGHHKNLIGNYKIHLW